MDIISQNASFVEAYITYNSKKEGGEGRMLRKQRERERRGDEKRGKKDKIVKKILNKTS